MNGELKGERPLFGRCDWQAAGVTASLALLFYFVTLAPTVTLEQSGAFVVAGEYLGVGRVPGYPLWHILAKIFITLFGFVHYRGQPNPAWATNFMSAVFGALSCGLVALLASRVGRALSGRPEVGDRRTLAAAVIAGLLFAACPVMWSQSVITETYTLTLFCILLFFVACAVWLDRPSARAACGLAAVFGLGLAQSEFVILLLPCFLLALGLGEPRLLRDFCLANLFLWVLPLALVLSGFPRPWLFPAAGSSALLGLLLPLGLSPSGPRALAMTGLLALMLSLYAYLPLASEGNPPIQFGYPRTWEGFVFVINRGQYERIVPGNVLSLFFLEQLDWFGRLLFRQLGFMVVLAGLVPFFAIRRLPPAWRKWLGVCVLGVFMFSVVVVWGSCPRMDIQDSAFQQVRYIPCFALWALLAGAGFSWLAHRLFPGE